MAWQIDSKVIPQAIQLTAARTQLFKENPLRSGYRIYNHATNNQPVYHSYDERVSALSPDKILPGGFLEDIGEWQTVHHGEVWVFITTPADTPLLVTEEIIARKKTLDYEEKPEKKWWQKNPW